MSTHDFPKNHLQFCVSGSESDNFIFIEIKNTKFSCRKKDITIRLIVVSLLYLCFLLLATEGVLLFHTFFLITLGFFMYQLLSLVDRETLKVAKNFGVEKTVVLSFGRSNSLFVPYENIHRIVITEVIYFNRIISVLHLLKSNEGPSIIALFDSLLPPAACLELVFRSIDSLVNKD